MDSAEHTTDFWSSEESSTLSSIQSSIPNSMSDLYAGYTVDAHTNYDYPFHTHLDFVASDSSAKTDATFLHKHDLDVIIDIKNSYFVTVIQVPYTVYHEASRIGMGDILSFNGNTERLWKVVKVYLSAPGVESVIYVIHDVKFGVNIFLSAPRMWTMEIGDA
jgi:hypothetical protein